MDKFFISVGKMSCNYDEKLIVLNGVRIKKGLDQYMYIPTVEHSFKNRQEMIDKLTEIANKMWDEIDCIHEDEEKVRW